jgi:peptidoglycan hydrolase CwlO-like protein
MKIKLKNALLLIGFFLLSIILIFSVGGKGVLERYIKNKISRRKNELLELEKRERDLQERLNSNNVEIDRYNSELEKIKRRRNEIKEEVKTLDDESLAKELGSLLK